MKDKSNIIIGLLILIAVLLISAITLMFTPININRKYTHNSEVLTSDISKININWTAKYKAPMILPESEKLDIEKKIQIYVTIRLYSVTMRYSSVHLNHMSLEELQMIFDAEDIVKKILRDSDTDILEKLRNIKSVKLNKIWFEKEMRQEKIDSLKKILLTNR